MIRVDEVVKRYAKGRVTALAGVSLTVQPGEVFGLIGPDGAGKTTLFRILTTLLTPDAGRAEVLGYDVVRDYRAIRERVGYMPGRFSLYQDLSVEENVRFFARVFGTTLEANYENIREIYQQIEPFKDRRAGALSGGMKQKLALSCALIHKPEVLFMDEPTTGVDPVSRREFWDMLARLRTRGLTVLVSTPYMDEASRCDRVALMHGGELLRIDTPAAITATYPHPLWALTATDNYHLLRAARDWSGTHTAFAFGERVHVAARIGAEREALLGHLSAAGLHELSLDAVSPSIEDSFLDLLHHRSATATAHA